jgi:ribosomal protein S18 acetylase RimI-like enzyme
MTGRVKTRPVTNADDDLLYEIYCSTRADEVAGFGWERDAIDAFLRMQFDARQRAYESTYAGCENAILLFDGRDAGSIIIERGEREIALVDIAVLTEFRKNGVATHVIEKLQAEAAMSGRPFTLRVSKQNTRAIALYEKLGFRLVGESDLMFAMEWLPARR